MDFDVNEIDLYNGIISLNTLGNMLSDLSSVISSVDISDVQLASAYLLDSAKTNISSMYSRDYSVLYNKINNIKNMLCRGNEELEKLFKDVSDIALDDDAVAINLANVKQGSFYQLSDTKLTAKMGCNENGPSGSETWYDLGMSLVVENMETLYGYSDLKYSVREDGVKLLSGVTPDGERFENLVIVAADVYHEVANPDGTFQRGQIVETSLGMGIVADYCERSVNMRKNDGSVHFDIATAWHTGEYMANAYGPEENVVSLTSVEQVVPGQTGKTTLQYFVDDDSYKATPDVTTISLSDDPFATDETLKTNDTPVVKDTTKETTAVKSYTSDVPLIYQSDYNDSYGTGTLATHGCGITSLAMVASYYNDTEITPDVLIARDGDYQYGKYGSDSGTGHEIFAATADELNLPLQEQIHYSTEADLNKVVDALGEGCVVIAKAKSSSVFTNSGHYIVLTGVTEDGKITVNDPNKYNYNEYNEWNGNVLTDGFANGFDQEQFKYGKIEEFFVYSPKSE